MPYGMVLHINLTIVGRFMYAREEILHLLTIVEAIVLRGGASEGTSSVRASC